MEYVFFFFLFFFFLFFFFFFVMFFIYIKAEYDSRPAYMEYENKAK